MFDVGDFARRWADEMEVYLPTSLCRDQLRERFDKWAGELHVAITDRSRLREVAGQIGAGLVAERLVAPPVLRGTVEFVGRTLTERAVPADMVAAVQGALAEGFAGAIADHTRSEQESLLLATHAQRRDTETALRTSDARFRAVFTQSGLGIATVGLDGLILDANAALLAMLGCSLDQVRDRFAFDFVHPDDVELIVNVHNDMLAGAKDTHRGEERIIRSDGEIRWCTWSVSMVRDAHTAPQFVVVMLEDITERHQLQRTLQHQATHDPLTQLANRSVILERLDILFERSEPDTEIGLCYLDLDGFKVINDSLGHHVGDQLLVVIAERVAACVGADPSRLAARMGGDEFVILLERCPTTDTVVEVADRVLEAVAAPVRVCGHELRVTASVGIVRAELGNTSPGELMQAADITLYWAKSEGKGRWALYDAERKAREVAKFTLSATMPAALERGEFFVEYQPLVRLGDETLAGAEALVRWQHPQMGRLGPNQFIDLAEETGHIVELGRWVLHQACWQATRWDGLLVSVNLAARQVQDPAVVEEVAAVLDQTGLEPSRLQLELTESAVMGSDDEALATLRRLADLGVRIAIDDFGTGYSNLAYLRRLPVHALKLAGSFMEGLRGPAADPVDEQIVETLVSLAHALGLTVTAEVVETAEQAARLRAIGCDWAQGWLYARPGSAETIGELLRGRAPLSSAICPRLGG